MVTSRLTISAARHRPTPPQLPTAAWIHKPEEDTARHNDSLIKLSHRG
jgi:hypothetical protein